MGDKVLADCLIDFTDDPYSLSHHLASKQTFLGVGGWIHNVQGKYHVFSETYVASRPRHIPIIFLTTLCFCSVSTIRAAVDLKATFDQMAAAEKAGNLTPEQRLKLEEAATEKVRSILAHALFSITHYRHVLLSSTGHTDIVQGEPSLPTKFKMVQTVLILTVIVHRERNLKSSLSSVKSANASSHPNLSCGVDPGQVPSHTQ